MAKPEPNGKTWEKHQHVIMAINIKSVNDFEPVDGATPVFYGSKAPFTITGQRDTGQPITINGTEVKTYGGNINNSTPVLLVTRVRDIENGDIADLDKKYIVSSNVALAKETNTITATITDKLYGNWNSLPELTKHYMLQYNYIFDRDNVRREKLIKKATADLSAAYKPSPRGAKAQTLSREKAQEARLQAEEAARLQAEQEEAARLQAQQEEAARLQAEQEAARLQLAQKEEIDAKTILAARTSELQVAKAEQVKPAQIAAPKAAQIVAPKTAPKPAQIVAPKTAQKPAQIVAPKTAPKPVEKAEPTTEAGCRETYKNDPFKRNHCLGVVERRIEAENKARKAAEDANKLEQNRKSAARTRANENRMRGGGSLKDDLTNLNIIITDTNPNFKKYVYFLLMQPFYFKLNALTPTLLDQIKNYNLSGGGSSGTFNTHILQPFSKFSYVKYVNNVTDKVALTNHLSELIQHPEQSNIISNFADQIEKDTDNYKQLTKSEPNGYYIHIFRFIELIEKAVERYLNKIEELNIIQAFSQYALERIHAHMQQVMPLFALLTPINKILIQDNLNQKPLHVYIDDYVSRQTRTDVITYLKITNTEPEELSGNKSWNQRYDIRLKQAELAGGSSYKFNAMILGYKTDSIPFYKKTTINGKDKIVAEDNLDEIVDYARVTDESSKEISNIIKYDNYYLFGNYENIFPLYKTGDKKETNLENAKRMTAIIEQICTHKKPVFLLGYGASGSGKTSSLIYFNNGKTPDEQNGIVIHLCKEIIEKLNAPVDPAESVNSVKIVVKEFYTTNKQQTNVSGPYVFKPDLTYEGDIGQPKHAYHVNMNNPGEDFKTMGQVLKQLVDVDRYVKATTNNPQSSRSHVLVFIQFCSEADGTKPIRNLIIGDFAGKENVFQCTDTDTVVEFLNKKVENKEIVKQLNSKLPDDALKPETYTFYGAQLMQSGGDQYANDPFDKLVDDKMLTQEELNNRGILKTASGMLFDFAKPSNSINVTDINAPTNYESFKTFADQYAPIVIKYYFKNEPVLQNVQTTSVEPLNNSKIYNKLLNDTYTTPIDTGIDIIKKQKDVTDMKAATLLQELILVDLFENIVINKDKLNHVKLIQATTDATVSAAGSKVYTAMADITRYNKSKYGETKDKRRLKLITDSPYIIENPGYASVMNTNHVDIINADIEIANKPQSNWADPIWLNTNIIDKFTEPDKDLHDIYLYDDAMPKYKDPFDRGREKAIPIVKSFTISTMCKYFMKNRFKSLLPFFEEKQSKNPNNPKQPATGIFYEKYSDKHYYVNEFKYILDSLNTPDNDLNRYIKLIDIYQKNIKISQVRLNYGKQVCENRVIEGKYINSSLDQIRQTFKYILSKKHENSDALFNSPDFIDICLKSYCPTGINCFNTSSTDNAPESLIDEIYNYIQSTMDTEKANKYTKDEFYKEIVISVFGVFNVSRLADNPPTVPYIDINHLKQIYYNKDSEYSKQYPILWVLRKLNEQINNLPLVTNKSFITNLTKLITDAKTDYIIHNNPENILTMLEQSSVSFKVGDRLKEIIEEIDIHNAASTIGTLEFLDQLAKFNSVNNLCYKNTVDDTTPYLDDKDLDLESRIVESEYTKYVANAAPI
jgi:hypothetical protein